MNSFTSKLDSAECILVHVTPTTTTANDCGGRPSMEDDNPSSSTVASLAQHSPLRPKVPNCRRGPRAQGPGPLAQ